MKSGKSNKRGNGTPSPNGRKAGMGAEQQSTHYDVAILGAGLAGLSLARQLTLRTNQKILILDRSAQVPTPRQKVGESTVQLGAYYLSKVLDLEEHLFREHLLKYNLRFYYKRPGVSNRSYEEYSQSYIDAQSNIAGYQLDRNTLEAELLRLSTANSNVTFRAPAKDLSVSLSEHGPHSLRYTFDGAERNETAEWVVDSSGRGKYLARRMDLPRPSPIRHGSSFLWVDGLVDVEKLTDLSLDEILRRHDRAQTGHFPIWLATNHYVGEGFWFWVIPLQGKTSLGVVYDSALFPASEVATPEKLISWVCREFPVFARDLPHRKILDHGSFRSFAYDCAETLGAHKWALSGEAGRFSDPLYSPGSDLISLHNTLIADLILTSDDRERAKKVPLYETLLRSLYQAYIPSYAESYDSLGDQEAFALKYTWELAVYFTFYVFPFINNLFTDRKFLLPFLGKFARLGRINSNLQPFFSSFYQWKKLQPAPEAQVFFDFTQIGPLATSKRLFYSVGLSADDALDVLDTHLANLKNLARFILAHCASRALGDESVLTHRSFVESLDLTRTQFDPEAFRALWASVSQQKARYEWPFDSSVLDPFRTGPLKPMRKSAAATGGRKVAAPQSLLVQP
jgi:flavin-dependent dehydrogenase